VYIIIIYGEVSIEANGPVVKMDDMAQWLVSQTCNQQSLNLIKILFTLIA